MAILDRIDKMKKEGLDDPQITQRLREEGSTPREIDEAMDQDRVKSAVGTYPDSGEYSETTEEVPYPSFQPQTEHSPDDRIEIPAEYPSEEPYPQYQEQAQYPQAQEQYPEYQYDYSQPMDTEIITEIAEQIIEEKTNEMQKSIDELNKFKIQILGKADNLNERLRRIEKNIDKLQASVIGQVGNYGKNIADLKKEMQMTQESFSKIINPLSEHMKELKKIAQGTDRKTKSKRKNSK